MDEELLNQLVQSLLSLDRDAEARRAAENRMRREDIPAEEMDSILAEELRRVRGELSRGRQDIADAFGRPGIRRLDFEGARRALSGAIDPVREFFRERGREVEAANILQHAALSGQELPPDSIARLEEIRSNPVRDALLAPFQAANRLDERMGGSLAALIEDLLSRAVDEARGNRDEEGTEIRSPRSQTLPPREMLEAAADVTRVAPSARAGGRREASIGPTPDPPFGNVIAQIISGIKRAAIEGTGS